MLHYKFTKSTKLLPFACKRFFTVRFVVSEILSTHFKENK
jgi:lipid-A-disaccharide synthase-like uncharacterized protein